MKNLNKGEVIQNLEWRYEVKFLVNAEEEIFLREWMFNQPTMYRSFAPRVVNSLYYDDMEKSSMGDNIAGISHRAKYRLRWYGPTYKPDDAKFEIKFRKGRLGAKKRFDLNFRKRNARTFGSRDLKKILAKSSAPTTFLSHLPELQPMALVSYTRDYYHLVSGVRMTIDSSLRLADASNNHVDAEDLTDAITKLIIEFKFPQNEKELAAELFTGFPFTASRNSKYLLSCYHSGHVTYF